MKCIRNTLQRDCKDTSKLFRRLLVRANTINQRTDIPIADIAVSIVLVLAAGFHPCSCSNEARACQKALLLPPSLNHSPSSSKSSVHVCSLAHLVFDDFYTSCNELQAMDELLARLALSKSKWERWQLRAGSSSILSSLGSKRLMYESQGKVKSCC